MISGVKRLAQSYRMDAAVLDRRLQTAKDEYQRNTSKAIPEKEDVKTVLKPIAKQAKALHKGLNELNPLISQALDYAPPLQYDLSVIDKRLGAISLEGTDSILSNLSIELAYIADKESDVINGWQKKKFPDTARNMAILRIAQAWKHLTNKPATFKTAKNKKISDDPDNKPPKYYAGKRYGEFLDFFTKACEIAGLKEGADANVKRFIELKRTHRDLL